MPDRPYQFTLTDAEGKEHPYVVGYHSADEGIEISLWLLAHSGAIATGLVPAVRDAVASLIGDADKVSAVLDVDASTAWAALSGALGSVSLEAVGTEWRKALLSPEARAILKTLFRHATRDGLDVGQGFGRMYAANYLEMYQAAVAIIKANRFFPWPGTSPVAGG